MGKKDVAPPSTIMKRKTTTPAPAGVAAGQVANNKKLAGEVRATATSDTAPRPARDWSEAGDLPEPSIDEVELLIQTALLQQGKLQRQELTQDLVLTTHALDEPAVSCPTARAAVLAKLTHLRLDRQHLCSLAPALPTHLPCLTHVYLQHNQLTSMQPLSGLVHLEFACLSHNLIEQVEGVQGLQHLMFLDLSHNHLHVLDASHLPQSLRFLKVCDNPCSATTITLAGTRHALRAHLPHLRDLDGPVADSDSSDGDEDDNDGDSEPDTNAQQTDSTQQPWLAGPGSHIVGSAAGSRLEEQAGPSEVATQHTTGRPVSTALDHLEALERSVCDTSMSVLTASVVAASLKAAGRTSLSVPEPTDTSEAVAPGAQALGSLSTSERRPSDSPVLRTKPSLGRSLSQQAPAATPSSSLAPPNPAPMSAVEREVLQDLDMLRGRLEALVEPLTAAAAAVAMVAAGSSRPGSSNARPKSSKSRPGTATGTPSADKQQDDEMARVARQGLHEQLDRLMGAAAARVAEQRVHDASMSQDIRQLRGSCSLLSELKQSLNLKAGSATGPGAIAAVRQAIQHSVLAPGIVTAALERHRTEQAVQGLGGAVQDSTSKLRASLSHLQQLTRSVLLEQGADVDTLEVGHRATAGSGAHMRTGSDDSDEDLNSEHVQGSGYSAPGMSSYQHSKYYRTVLQKAGVALQTDAEGSGSGSDDDTGGTGRYARIVQQRGV